MLKIDKFLLVLVFILSLLGLINFFSASYYFSLKNFNDPYFYFLRFLIRITLLGILLFFIGYFLAPKIHRYKKFIIFIFFLVYFSIFLGFLPQFKLAGATASRWVNLGPFSFQPSEIIKPLAILFYIFLFAGLKNFSLIQKNLIFILSSFFLILPIYLQPSLSNVLIIFSSILIVFLSFLKSNKEIFITLFIFLILVLILALISTFWSYRKERLLSFLTKGKLFEEKYFQIEQSILGISSGGISGKGLGRSEMKIIGLPQMLTDSIFTIYAEETGFIGSLLLVILFFFLILRIILIGLKGGDWKKPFCFSFAWWIFFQTFLHLSSNSGLIAPTGVILPFFSYGPSGQLAIYFSLGLISRDE
ncbi:MAG: putative lipid II flippase FtsW [Candidatus Parcubacteria bacterium]|nr:MAG: putative lipid II flippase FtsW [Candidatus Parcubacteria bacterium]